MNTSRVQFFLVLLFAGLSGILCITLSAFYYQCYIQKSCTPADDTRFTRGFVIESIDIKKMEGIGVYAIPTGTARFKFTMEDSTRITTREQRIKDGVIIGYEPISEVPKETMAPGMLAFGRFSTDADGLYVASSIVLGDIIPR